MKKLVYGGLFLALVGIGFVACEKESIQAPTVIENTKVKSQLSNTQSNKSLVIISEDNVGYYHNEMVKYIFDKIKKIGTASQINDSIKQSEFIKNIGIEFCNLHNIKLPNEFTKIPDELLYTDVTNNEVFSEQERSILNSSFDMVYSIDENSDCDLINNNLISKLNQISVLPNSKGNIIGKAIINQLISSLDLWISQNYSIYLPDYVKAKPGQNGRVLGKDASALGWSLLAGGWSSPIGWCGSMFISAGASIGAWMGEHGYNTTWWPW